MSKQNVWTNKARHLKKQRCIGHIKKKPNGETRFCLTDSISGDTHPFDSFWVAKKAGWVKG